MFIFMTACGQMTIFTLAHLNVNSIRGASNIYVNTNEVAGGFGWSIVVVTLLVHQQRTDIYLDSITNVNL